MNKEAQKMYDYLYQHGYISQNKKSNYQSELSVERAECIANKYSSLVKEENTNLKQALNEIREYIKLMGKYDGERCTRNFKMMSADFNHILQIIYKAIGDDNQ